MDVKTANDGGRGIVVSISRGVAAGEQTQQRARRIALGLSAVVAALMIAASTLGILVGDLYRKARGRGRRSGAVTS